MQPIRVAGIVVMLALILAACGAAAAPATEGTDSDAMITSGPMEFDSDTLSVPAGRPFSLLYVNQSPMPHNVAIYVDESVAEPLFVGEIIGEQSIVYDVPALAAGSYFFRCDLHPEMKGTVRAG
jgi:plastocyanin